jgi:hypothetical protein
VSLVVMTDGMDAEQRVEFDRLLREATGPGGHDAGSADRRAYALAFGEMQ